ncbi:MAG TPA: hypothetical protein VH478_16820 [Trebonia sp.]|jgi:hypothetical protein|nr:hypothetical protein [Trebonia sp.]
MRDFARREKDVVFGHASPIVGQIDGETQLERALHRYTEQTVPERGQRLRGYSWITLVPRVLAERLGGLGQLRASGAFPVVEELPGGTAWLQAAGSWQEYAGNQAAVDRVFETLRPVLLPGMPSRGFRAGNRSPWEPPAELIPYVLSPRDAAAFGAAAPREG